MNELNTSDDYSSMDNMPLSLSMSHPHLNVGPSADGRTQPPRLQSFGRSYSDTKPERNLWREQEMLQLLYIMRSLNAIELLNDKTVRSETVFRNIEKLMHDYGYRKKSYMQIWTKWKFLKSTYTTSRRAGSIPKVIPLAVYDALHEMLNIPTSSSMSVAGEFSTSTSSLVDAFAGSGCMADGTGEDGSATEKNCVKGGDARSIADEGSSTYASLKENNQLMIADVQGGVRYSNSGRKKVKATTVAVPQTDCDINGFGMQHPIFGFRLGVVKQEPLDTGYENNCLQSNLMENMNATSSCSSSANLSFHPQIKIETSSPPPIVNNNEQLHESSSPPPLHPMRRLNMPPHNKNQNHHPNDTPYRQLGVSLRTERSPQPPSLTQFATPMVLPKTEPAAQSTPVTPHPNMPRLKHVPLRRITLQPRIDHNNTIKNGPQSPPTTSSSSTTKIDVPPAGQPKKIPILTIRKRKRRLNIPMPPIEEPCPYSKKDDDEDDDDDDDEEEEVVPEVKVRPPKVQPQLRQQQQHYIPPSGQRVPRSQFFYGKAIRDLSTSLRSMQRQLIDEFFATQMQFAREEHEFQKQQDEMLLKCFEEQTRLILAGVNSVLTGNTTGNTSPPLEMVQQRNG